MLNYVLLRETRSDKSLWGYSSVGRAMRSQRIGHGFESHYLHQTAYKGASCALFACLALGHVRLCTLPSRSHLKVPNLQPFSAVWTQSKILFMLCHQSSPLCIFISDLLFFIYYLFHNAAFPMRAFSARKFCRARHT